jgi:hypothetical protein
MRCSLLNDWSGGMVAWHHQLRRRHSLTLNSSHPFDCLLLLLLLLPHSNARHYH